MNQTDHNYATNESPQKKKKRNTNFCCVPQCATYGKPGISLHLFPENPSMKTEWEIALRMGKPVSSAVKVCSRHYFRNNPERNTLCPHALPSQNIPKRTHKRKETSPRRQQRLDRAKKAEKHGLNQRHKSENVINAETESLTAEPALPTPSHHHMTVSVQVVELMPGSAVEVPPSYSQTPRSYSGESKRTALRQNQGITGARVPAPRSPTCLPSVYEYEPKNDEIRATSKLVHWAKIINRLDMLKNKNPKNFKICSAHFDASVLKDDHLPKNATPTVNLPNTNEGNSEFKDEPMAFEEVVPEAKDSNGKETENDEKMENDDDEWEDIDSDDESNDDSEEMEEEYNDDDDDSSPYEHDEDVEDEQDEEQLAEKLGDSPFSSVIAQLPRAKKSFEMYQKLMKRKFQGKQNTVEYRNWALRLYFSNPELYKMFTARLELPIAKDLLSQAKINFQTGTNKGIVTLLGRKLRNMPQYEYKKSPWLLGAPTKIKKNPQHYKYCTLGIEEVDIVPNMQYDQAQDYIVGFHDVNGKRSKEPANKALVFMLRGSHEVWKQVIGYVFMAENKETNVAELNEWLNETLTLLKESGFDVCSVVTSDAKIFIELAKLKGVSAENPSFKVGNQKILFMFDVPNLMNSTRDLFMENDFEFNGGKIATWKHIEYFHGLSSGKSILPETHVKPNEKERKQVYYAAGIFSQKLAAYLHMSQKIESAPPKITETAEFLSSMNKTFEILNCNTTKKRGEYNKYKRPYKGADYQTEQLNAALEMLRTAQIKTDEEAAKSTELFQCWQITIKAVLELFEYYKSQNLDYILTRRLNTEPIGWFLQFVYKRISSIGSPKLGSDSDGEDFAELEKVLFGADSDSEVDPNEVTAWKFRGAYSQVALRDLMTNSLVNKSGENYDDFLLGDKFDTTCMFRN